MGAETVLIIEDDEAMRRVLCDNFELDGYSVEAACNGDAGLRRALSSDIDLIVLDLMLPGINGYEICRQVREGGIDAPIIMLTAKDQESDVVLGLNLGADDYVTKPFRIRELLARANAFLRRRRSTQDPLFRFGEWELDTVSHEVRRDGSTVDLTPKEYRLLEYFLRNAGRALTRDQILDHVWGSDVFVTSRSATAASRLCAASWHQVAPSSRPSGMSATASMTERIGGRKTTPERPPTKLPAGRIRPPA